MKTCLFASGNSRRGATWSRLRSGVVALLASLLLGSGLAQGEPADFHDLSPQERDKWLNDLRGVLDETKQSSKKPLDLDTMAPQPWEQFRDGISWRIDESGFVVLDDGQRPMGSRIFARSCYLQHGDSFRHWAENYASGLKIAHLLATAITETGCSEAAAQGSVDNKSTGLMQVTGYTCRSVLSYLGKRDMTEKACLDRMAAEPDFSIELAAAYITQPAQLKMTELDPPKVAAAYNAGGLYFDPKNPWRLRSTGNHIDRFVSAYNAYVAWQRDEAAGRKTRSPAVHLTRSVSLPDHVESLAALNALTQMAKDGDIVFVGDWDLKRGDYYVFVKGAWRGSLEDSES